MTNFLNPTVRVAVWQRTRPPHYLTKCRPTCAYVGLKQSEHRSITVLNLWINPLMRTLKPQRNGPLYSNTVIGTLAVDGWAVTFGTAMRGLGALLAVLY